MLDSATHPDRVLLVDADAGALDRFRAVLGAPCRPAGARTLELSMVSLQEVEAPPRFEVLGAPDGEAGYCLAREALSARRPFAVAFVALGLRGGWDGVRTVQALWALDPHLQVVLCAEESDQGFGLLMDALGPADRLVFVRKPLEPKETWQFASMLAKKRLLQLESAQRVASLEELTERLATSNRRLEEEMQQRAAAEARLRFLANHDTLTGLPNRVLFRERLDACLGRRRAGSETESAVLFLDLDDFKLVNDAYGHQTGDQLLVECARRIRASLGHLDSVSRLEGFAARLGGDEFVVLLEGLCGQRDAIQVAERILDHLERPISMGSREIKISASIGLTYVSNPEATAHDLLREADTAMYRSKGQGRGGYALFDTGMHAQVSQRLALENDLHRVVEQDQLFLQYQPIVGLGRQETVGFEALVRWQHPVEGVIAPDRFIGLAEETGSINSIGRWVLENACRRLVAWTLQSPQAAQWCINVNVSPRQLLDPGFEKCVDDALRTSGLPGSRLVLEITETAVLAHADAAFELLCRLRSKGIRIQVDDFGTGYSALSYLLRFPFDGVKIDRSFVHSLSEDPRSVRMIRAVTSLAHQLDAKVTVEGVENLAQLEQVREAGCDHVQGFYFARGLNAESVLSWSPERRLGAPAPALRE